MFALAGGGGALAVCAFAPFYFWQLAPPLLACLFFAAVHSVTVRRAAALGFGCAFVFFAAGLFWIYQALSGYIGLSPFPAALLSALLFAYLSLYSAASCAIARALAPAGKIVALFAAAATWTLLEKTREIAFTGFPWFAAGYSQIPQSPLAGWAPLFGISGVTFALTLCAACLACAALPGVNIYRRIAALAFAFLLFAGGAIAKNAEWTETGGTVTASLLQGNVKQKLKWQRGEVKRALADYLAMAKRAPGAIIVLPETALPMAQSDLPPGYLDELSAIAEERGGAVVAGLFAVEENKTYNAALALGAFPANDYRKRHLTPYGEYLPFGELLGPFLMREWMAFFSLSPGESAEPLRLNDMRAGVMICYEDIFGGELREQLPAANFLANLTNDGWFDGSAMAAQHVQYSQARALESGRDLVRATNTGVSAFINHKGEITKTFPPQKQGILTGKITIRTGATPYATHGDAPALLIALLILITAFARFILRR